MSAIWNDGYSIFVDGNTPASLQTNEIQTAQKVGQYFYVNDLVTGADTSEGAYRFYDETNTVLAAAEIKL